METRKLEVVKDLPVKAAGGGLLGDSVPVPTVFCNLPFSPQGLTGGCQWHRMGCTLDEQLPLSWTKFTQGSKVTSFVLHYTDTGVLIC